MGPALALGKAKRSLHEAALPLPARRRPRAAAPRLRSPGLVQDWAQACNTKHLDDLIELYASDATLIRSSVPPVRSLPAIREFLFSLLEAGLGDVEMESLRTEVMGEIALELGAARCWCRSRWASAAKSAENI